MVRLRGIEITGFRGCRFPMSVDFTTNCKSIAIFGENASGKSSITDAIEWLVFDRVGHLWREDCKEGALRNVRLPGCEDAVVSLAFNDKDLAISKTLRSNLSITANKARGAKSYLDQARSERLILRAADMTSFVNKTKADKRQEVASIVGYDDVLGFRNTIQSALNALRREDAYATAKSLADTRQAKLLLLTGKSLSLPHELYLTLDELVVPYALGFSITDADSCDAAIKGLTARFNQQEKAQRKLSLDRARGAAEELIGAIVNTRDPERTFFSAYDRTLESKEQVQKLTLEDFLRKGKSIVDEHVCEPGKCPLCGKEADLGTLSQQLQARIEEYDAVRKEFEAVRSLKATYLNALNGAAIACAPLDKCSVDLAPQFGPELKQFTAAIAERARSVRDKFERFEPVPQRADFTTLAKEFQLTLEGCVLNANEEAKGLELSDAERKIVDLITRITDLRSTFREFSLNSAFKRVYEVQITTLQTIFNAFVAVQSSALQNVLDVVSCDVGKYYGILHPDESVDRVRLRVVDEEGIEFEYFFHGEPTYPPMKYLSESHLNSLGIALFLASVKLFNKRSNFFVLDDIITSFDMGHRRRLIRLFADQFRDWQIILLTHESFWFDLIKRELGPCGWLVAEVCCDAENGTQLKSSPMDLWELIAAKRKKHLAVANDVRTLIERVLKQLCERLEVKVAFRYNETNEQRMSQELLCALRSSLNKKCPALKDNPILPRLEASVLVTNVGSHDRPDIIADADIDVALGDVEELQRLFGCPDCSTFVSARQIVPGEDKIACRCGKAAIPWKA
jgi:hypothetical protein